MVAFGLIAAAMTLAALAFVLARLVVPRRGSPHADPREANLVALRAARAEIDRDRAAGLLPADEVDAARDELTRRAAEELDEAVPCAPMRPAWATAACLALGLPLAAWAAYGTLGNPGAVEQGRAFARLSGPVTVERLPQLREELAQRVASDAKDARAWALLGRVELALDRFPESENAFAEAVKDRKVALDPAVWCDYADAAALAQGGRLEGKPAQFVARALSLDPVHPRALEMAGSLAVERRDFATAAHQWRALLDLLAANDPRRDDLSRAIARVERLASRGS